MAHPKGNKGADLQKSMVCSQKAKQSREDGQLGRGGGEDEEVHWSGQ